MSNDKKKMLYISAFPPNYLSGGQKFSMNVINDLSKNFIIDLIYFSYPGHKLSNELTVNSVTCYKPDLKNCLNQLFYFPSYTKRFSYKILKEIRKIARNYDCLYFDYSQVSIYSKYINHPNKIIRLHDILFQKFNRKKSVFLPLIKYNENTILKSANKVFVPSEKDTKILKEIYKIDSFCTNEYLSFFEFPLEIQCKKQFLFFGLWSRPENTRGLTWFLENVYDKIDQNITIKIMGGGMDTSYKESFLTSRNIEYLGFVEDSYFEIVQSAAVIVPLFEGAGIKVKVLDAYTTGTPVIGTDIAFEGIPEIEGLTYLAKKASDFASIINNFEVLQLQDKKRLRNTFLEIYDKNHLSDYIL